MWNPLLYMGFVCQPRTSFGRFILVLHRDRQTFSITPGLCPTKCQVLWAQGLRVVLWRTDPMKWMHLTYNALKQKYLFNSHNPSCNFLHFLKNCLFPFFNNFYCSISRMCYKPLTSTAVSWFINVVTWHLQCSFINKLFRMSNKKSFPKSS